MGRATAFLRMDGPFRSDGRPVPRRVVALLAAFVLALTGLTLSPRAARAEDPLTFRVAQTQVPDSFNPFLGIFSSSAELFRLQYDTLYSSSAENYTPTPSLATGYTKNADGTVWDFTLRDAKWSDGQPLTAEDVSWTLNKIMTDPDAQAGNGSTVANYKSVTAKDAKTVEIVTKQPTPTAYMLGNQAQIVPKHIWEKKDAGKDPNTDFPVVGSGPYVISEYKTDQFVRLTRNPNYWGPAPKVDQLVFTYFKDSDAAVQALLKGDIDLIGDMTTPQFNSLQGKPDIAARAATGRRFTEITFNPGAKKDGKSIGDGHPALADVRVRQALHYAIDIPTLVDKTQQGNATAAGGYIPPAFSNWSWTPDDATKINFDISKANQLLDEAGYKRGSDGIRTMPDGSRPLKFRLIGHAEKATETPQSEFIKGWFGQLGITVQPQMVSNSALNEEISKGNFDIAFSGWSANSDPDFILSIQTCDSPSSDTYYCNADYDKMYAEQSKEVDDGLRKQIVADMQKNLYVNAPVITLFYPKQLEAQRTDRFEPLVRQPQPDGVSIGQEGRWGLASITPKGDTGSTTAGSSGIGTGGVVGIIVGAVVLIAIIAGAVVLLRRRRGTAEDKE